MTMARHRAQRRPAAVRREEILDAAVRVFARAPFRVAGTAEIARAAGIAEPTLYRYFGSKRDLYLAALDRCCVIIRDEFQRIADQTVVAADALHAIGEWYVGIIRSHPDYLRLRLRAVAEADEREIQDTL
jgi:AcrR family transcriptional regulator